MAEIDRRSEVDRDQDQERRMEGGTSGTRRDERRYVDDRRRREYGRDQGAWPYAGPLSPVGYVPPNYMGYPGYMSSPWSRFSHGMDPSYQDWQGPAFGTSTPGGWEPRVDTYRRDDAVVVRVELPGWDKDEVSVCVEGEDLVVEGLREEDVEEAGDRRREEWRRDEERFGSRYSAERFSTRVPLPAGVDPSELKAKFKNGVLEVRIPMPEKRAERRTVKIDT